MNTDEQWVASAISNTVRMKYQPLLAKYFIRAYP